VTAGVLGETIRLRATLVVAAINPLIGALWLATSPVRTLKTVEAVEMVQA